MAEGKVFMRTYTPILLHAETAKARGFYIMSHFIAYVQAFQLTHINFHNHTQRAKQ